jgi:hypothetical protein
LAYGRCSKYAAIRDSDQHRHTEAALKKAEILHSDHGPHHVSDDVLYSLKPGPWLTTTEPPGRGGGRARARGGRSGGVGRGVVTPVSTELGRGSFSLHEWAGRQGMGSWQADQTMAVGTGAVGARLVIGLLIGGLIANSQARREARALEPVTSSIGC